MKKTDSISSRHRQAAETCHRMIKGRENTRKRSTGALSFFCLMIAFTPGMTQSLLPVPGDQLFLTPDENRRLPAETPKGVFLDFPVPAEASIQDSNSTQLKTRQAAMDWEKKTDTANIPETREIPEEPSARSRVFLEGSVRNVASDAHLDQVSAEVFILDDQGQMQRAYSGSTRGRQFFLPLIRETPHILILRKSGYKPMAVYLEPADTDLQQIFRLEERSRPAFVPEDVFVFCGPPDFEENYSPDSIYVGDEEAALDSLIAGIAFFEENDAFRHRRLSISGENSGNQKPIGAFEVLEATSLRREPYFKSEILLRLNQGDELEVLEKTNAHWWKARFKKEQGFVKAFMLLPKE